MIAGIVLASLAVLVVVGLWVIYPRVGAWMVREKVVPKLEAIATTGYNERIYVRGDTAAAYGVVMKVMARISAAGFKNIGLVTLQEQEK